jgi:hypothetical protein
MSPRTDMTPPQPIVCCTSAHSSERVLGGTAAAAQKIDIAMSPSTLTSRIPPSATMPATPMAIMRAISASPSAPLLSSRIMSMTTTLPGGIAWIVPATWLDALARLERSVRF